MELRQLKYFVNVAKLRSFSEASRILYISQSTLSQQIKQLEDELGVQLLVRNSRYVQISDYGEVFLPAAEAILQKSEDSIAKIKDVRNLKTGSLSIGATSSFCPLLNETLKSFMSQYPGIQLNIFCGTMEELMQKLESKEIDIALSYKPLQRYENIESHILFESKLSVIVSKFHSLSGKDKIRLSDLEKYPLALPAKGMQARNVFDNMLFGQDYRLDIRLEINDINVLLDLVSRGSLATVLSQSTIRNHEEFQAIPFETDMSVMEGSYHILKGAYCKTVTKVLLQQLVENNAFNQALQAIG